MSGPCASSTLLCAARASQQLLVKMVSARSPSLWPSVTQHGQAVTSMFVRLILRRLVLSHERSVSSPAPNVDWALTDAYADSTEIYWQGLTARDRDLCSCLLLQV